MNRINFKKIFLLLCAFFLLFLVWALSVYTDFSDGYDITRHRLVFDKAVSDPETYVDYFSSEKLDLIFYKLILYGSQYFSSAEIFFGFMSAATLGIILLATLLVNKSAGVFYILLVISFSFINMSLLSGVRFYLGLSFLAISLFFLSRSLIIYQILFFVLSFLTHFGFFIYLPFLLLNKFDFKGLRKLCLIVFPLFAIVSLYPDIFVGAINHVGFGNLSAHLLNYVNSDSKFDRVVFYYIIRYSPLLFFIILIMRSPHNRLFINQLTYAVFVTVISLTNFVFFDRAYSVFLLVACFYLISNYLFYRPYTLIFLFLLFVSFLSEVYSNLDLYL